MPPPVTEPAPSEPAPTGTASEETIPRTPTPPTGEPEDPWGYENAPSGSGADSSNEYVPPPPPASPPANDYAAWYRRSSTHEQNALAGSTGLQRVHQAGSGAPGTFRFGLIAGFFGQSGFLCNANTPCADPVTGFTRGSDNVQRLEALATLSVTPFSFLEAYLNIRNSATSNSNGRPQLLQVVGDTIVGVKGFSPAQADQLFFYGGEAELAFLTGSGGVGLNGGATSFALRGLGTLDLNNRRKEEDRLPFRVHLNLGYFFDNSAAIVSQLEAARPPSGRGGPIERTERYGLNLSRVDAFQFGLGAEYIHDYVRPFLEWTLDVPVNRQGYVCNIQGAASRGDLCLGAAAGITSSPSRLSLGARVFPWQASGLAVTTALDIGTGGTGVFLEETRPETPYAIWIGVAYAVDTTPPAPIVITAARPPASASSIERVIVGQVKTANGDAAVPDAILRLEGGAYTGMVADSEGRFRSRNLPPGTYTFKVFADQYREASCQAVIPKSVAGGTASAEIASSATASSATGSSATASSATGSSATAPASAEGPLQADPYGETGTMRTQPVGTGPVRTPEGNIEVPLTCTLKELPRVAKIVGVVIDGKSGAPVADATVTLTDKLNRMLSLAADARGSLLFQNVPFGTSHLTATAPGYLTTVMPINVDSRKELEVHVVLNKRPQKLSVEVGPRELKLTKPIRFIGETAQVTADTMIVVEELASVLRDNQKLGNVEIQVHADDAGAASYSRRLTQERADQVRTLLTQMGVDETRISAKGFGPDRPLTPNVSDASREKNRRVQVVLVKP